MGLKKARQNRACLLCGDYYTMTTNLKGNAEEPKQLLRPTYPSVRKPTIDIHTKFLHP